MKKNDDITTINDIPYLVTIAGRGGIIKRLLTRKNGSSTINNVPYLVSVSGGGGGGCIKEIYE